MGHVCEDLVMSGLIGFERSPPPALLFAMEIWGAGIIGLIFHTCSLNVCMHAKIVARKAVAERQWPSRQMNAVMLTSICESSAGPPSPLSHPGQRDLF